MTIVSRADACVYVDKIREGNGGISRQDREFLEREKPQVLVALENLQRRLGATTKALAAELYAKDTRFVYELIQNAEDNSYRVANNESEPPWLRFALDQDRIVIDSNEDGFSEANIKAICSIGESTKTSIQGYIGEKGIGFKSVFKVARKVHVQSGSYSFAFEYQRDGNDNGLGMVTPMNEEYLDIPNGVRTRIILYLLTTCDRDALRKEFLDLPDTLLLFLKKLERLSIMITIPGERDVERNYSLSESGNKVSIHKSLPQLNSTSTQNYWTTRREVSNMPNDHARKNVSKAEVVLAFPLDADDTPVIKNQHVFAFLPLRKVGYKKFRDEEGDPLLADFENEEHTAYIWASSRNASIYFPTSGGIEIPANLGLALIDSGALRNSSRMTLFGKLGVTECDPSRVFPLIEQFHRNPVLQSRETIPHIKFMFWHHTKLPTEGIKIMLLGNLGLFPTDAFARWTYNPRSEAPYSMSKVFGASIPDVLDNTIVRFLSPIYHEALEHLDRRNDQTALDWLARFLEMKNNPQLRQRSNARKVSSELKYIMNHQPQFLLHVLEANWYQYQLRLWDRHVKPTRVPVLHSDQLQSLDKTYLPLPKLMAIVLRLGLEQDFGFLKELDGIADSAASKWMFLERFGVGMEENVSFWLALLKQAKHQEAVQSAVVFEIYTNLQKFVGSKDIEEIRTVFNEDAYVFLPSESSNETPSWRFAEDCVWDGPQWFTYKASLTSTEQYRQLYSLFQVTLGVRDANCDDFMACLESFKNSETDMSSDEEAKVVLLYQQLYKVAIDSNELGVNEKIRIEIEVECLVYNYHSRTWHNPSSCIWAEDEIRLPGKLSIATMYKTLKPFFLGVLRITKPSLEMHISALKEKASTNPDKYSIFREILNICAFDIPFKALESLRNCKCLPVKLSSGTTEWSDCSKDFAIVNRRDYSQTFAGRINVLDFSLEEVHSLKPFLSGLGLEERFLSRAVREETTVQGGSKDERLTADLRKKSYAICRYAAHLGSKRAHEDPVSMHQTLQNIDVYVSNAISKSVSIDQNGATVTVPQAIAYFHLDQVEGKLNLYVPQSKNNQRLCLSRELPITLLQHFGVPKDANGAELGSIITESSLFVIDGLLEQAGIIEVEGIMRPEDESEDEVSSPGTEDIARSTPGSTAQTRSSRHGTEPQAPRTPPSQSSSTQESYPTPNSSQFDRAPSPPERPDLYQELLNAVVLQAESLHHLPQKGQTILAPVLGRLAIGFDTSLAVHSSIVGEREFKIGAAGELFVFEFLKGLALPNFTLRNWQSTIRHRVAVHERYHGLLRWIGSETADIVYLDRESTLTNLLIATGYLQASTWRHKTPEYYIEVKTTTGLLDTPFYCSQAQYDRMEDMKFLATFSSEKVYLVARVFSLGSSRMGLKLYMDPAEKRELEFKTDKYSVTPIYTF
ncbi:hypothetical protein BU16DRAFT_504059 [Lophium mytilinum]|uniref:Protein NO VEIN C-terminal domain-containing protein n=1 Tax=Lophium mytilinum TaxID=390894 RepID=A0A6A6R4S4_9PEZI|nr:hypothetical protein BU16DRAFT_504059 [Lophium mytilinum]